MKNIGIAFLGSGWAQKVQAPCFAMLDGVKLIGASSPNNANGFAAAFKMPIGTSEWKELVVHPDVDLVCITSPPLLHHEQTLFALQQNKHVLCEKPFAMTTSQAEEMAALAKTKKLLTVIDHELRFSPGMRYVHDKVRSGELGKVYYASATLITSGRRDPGMPYTWWCDKAWGGGTWGAIGSHLIDLVRYIVDEVSDSHTLLSTSITARKDKEGKVKQVTSDETATSILRLTNGVVAHLFCSVIGSENKFELEVTGEKGSIRIDNQDAVFRKDGSGSEEKVNIELDQTQRTNIEKYTHSKATVNSPFSRAFVHFADEIVKTLQAGGTKVKNAATFEDGVKVQQVLDRASP